MTTDTNGDTLRIGFIGAGANTRTRHIPGFQAIEGVELAAVCNRSRESGQRVADEFGIARVVEDPGAIFDDPEIDAVCIGTWPYRHREYSVRALEAGKHVLCEARMAMDAAEAREMLDAARARPDRVAQLVPAPFDLASWRTIRRLLAEGALGELREAHVTLLGGGALDAATPLHWRERSEYSGRNTLMLGIVAETVQRWLGPSERVTADAATFVTSRRDAESGEDYEIGIPDSIGVFARMASGARVSYQLSAHTHAPARRQRHLALRQRRRRCTGRTPATAWRSPRSARSRSRSSRTPARQAHGTSRRTSSPRSARAPPSS